MPVRLPGSEAGGRGEAGGTQRGPGRSGGSELWPGAARQVAEPEEPRTVAAARELARPLQCRGFASG